MKMHDGELDIDGELVRRLLDAQFPKMADLPISAVESTGTVNAIYRLGDRLCVRLPRVDAYADDLADEQEAAADLARFVTELRETDVPLGAPPGGRKPLRDLDAMTRAAIGSARGVIDGDAALAAWDRALQAPAWDGAPVWIHSDLLRPNVLVRDGRLCAVIDFGGIGVGDRAADVIAAWSVFGRRGRAHFRAALGVDGGTWNRARGFALHQAAMIIPYYRATNPGFVALAKRTVEQVLLDVES
jgi:aminoglycoside phosphotransferase (APT) family kinase protein